MQGIRDAQALVRKEALSVWEDRELPVVDFTSADILEAARIAQIAPALSLGGCACLAAARRRGASEVLTTGRLWTRYDFGVPVTLVR
jgi:PIN domain nuclease of toxin-antitoxin system